MENGRHLLRFLLEAHLITATNPIIKLDGADLAEPTSYVPILRGADLRVPTSAGPTSAVPTSAVPTSAG